MNPLENHDIFFIVVNFLDRRSCFRLLSVNRQIRQWLGKSEIWQKFFDPKFKFNRKFTYRRLCQNIEGNFLVRVNIKIREYYGESYYRLIYQLLDFNGAINLGELCQANKEDIQKTKFLFKDVRHRHPNTWSKTDNRKKCQDEFFDYYLKLKEHFASISLLTLCQIFLDARDGYEISQIVIASDDVSFFTLSHLKIIDIECNRPCVINIVSTTRIRQIAQLNLDEIRKRVEPVRDFYQECLRCLDPRVELCELVQAIALLIEFASFIKSPYFKLKGQPIE